MCHIVKLPDTSRVIYQPRSNGMGQLEDLENTIAVEGFYTQMQADYLFDKKFQQIYVKCGPARTIDHPLLPKYIKISRPQLEEAKVHLYGAIKHSTKRSNTVLKYIYA